MILLKNTMKIASLGFMLVILAGTSGPAWAKSNKVNLIKDSYIVIMSEPPLVYFDGSAKLQSLSLKGKSLVATSPRVTGNKRLDVSTPAADAYKKFLDQRFDALQELIVANSGQPVKPRFRYYNLMNGFAATMDAATAEQIRQLPGVKSVHQDSRQYLHTYAGPEWIGAGSIWSGAGSLPATRGEGVVVGIIDSGINMDHPSFAETGDDGFTHTNPRGGFLGLCGQAGVSCNKKLIGVYDFTDEGTEGEDSSGHGSHTASTTAGNVLKNLLFTFGGTQLSYNLSGVAPHANIIAYKVCREDDPITSEDEAGCAGAAISSALDQAVTDAVDVVNYSIGANGQFNPWSPGSTAQSFLALREAGIFAATSAGNEGPGDSTIGSPANAPWVTGVAAASHDGVQGTRLKNMSGGSTTAPAAMVGEALTGGVATTDIVYAGDFGNALCGEGTAQLASSCAASNGSSKPSSWNSTTFAGKIVACDRGTYGRIEKSKNVMLAGAVGYILINTSAQGESTVADEHCLPAAHFGADRGRPLRDWLTAGSGQRAAIEAVQIRTIAEKADILASFSSRGPLHTPADVLKPNLIAPGRSILAAVDGGTNDYSFMNGTSMSSPHIAGAGALLKAANPSWTPDHIASALELTATMETARDFTGEAANFHQAGAGRPQLGLAATPGLYLQVSGQDFRNADPALGGSAKNLNLVGMTDPRCRNSCSFIRRVTDAMGGGSWSVSVEGISSINVVPNQFTLNNGASRSLTITVDATDPDLIGKWSYGTVVLTNTNGSAPDARLPLAVFGDGGDLPEELVIQSPYSGGSTLVNLAGLIAISDGSYQAAGLVKPIVRDVVISEDPTPNEAFNNDGGNIFELLDVPVEALFLRATTGDTTAADMDLYVGLDSNGNGRPDEDETVCSSLSGGSDEFCELSFPAEGRWWVMMQAYSNTPPVKAKLTTAVISGGNGSGSSLVATGQALVAENASQSMRVSWHDVPALQGAEYWGAISIGTDDGHVGNMGVIPVTFIRTGEDDSQKSIILGDDTPAKFVLPAGATHDRLVFDVPPGAGSVVFTLDAENPADNSNLKFRVFRLHFDDAFNDAPFVTAKPASASGKGQATGSGSIGPSVTVSGSSLTAGRYYIRAENTAAKSIAVTARAVHQGAAVRIQPRVGLWGDGAYNALGSQGFEYNEVGNLWFGIWYTYNEDGTSTWYFFDTGGLNAKDNSYTSDIIEFTNNPAVSPPSQKYTSVGKITITVVSETDIKFSYLLNGEYGGSPGVTLTPHTCVSKNQTPQPVTGTWAPNITMAGGIGGSSVEYGASTQALIHYIYDKTGEPRWVIGAGSVANMSMTALEYRGYCPTCIFIEPVGVDVGTISQAFSTPSAGTQTLDFSLQAPINSAFNRSMNIARLSDAIECK